VNVCVLFALVIGLTGCGRDDIQVYTVPKEQPPATQMPHGHPDGAATAPQLKWKLPVGWQEGAPSEFRLASFRIKDPAGKEADLSIIPLAGTAGGDLSNVNRWRGQVSQPPVSDTELKALAQPITVAGQPAELYDQVGEGPTGDPTRILAVIQHRAGTAWFFKMTGDDKFVAQQKPVLLEFLQSLQFAGSDLPAGHPEVSTPAAGKPRWTAPADWTEVAGGQFLVTKFTIAGGDAAVNVSSSPGDGGGVAANVNRWRKQLGLDELTGADLAKSVTTSGPVTFVTMNGTDARTGQPSAVVGAIVLQPGHAWFYKLMGDAKIVAAQKAAFTKFVQEVQY